MGWQCLLYSTMAGKVGALGGGCREALLETLWVRDREKERRAEGSEWPHACCGPCPGQDTYLSVPRLLLRKRRAICVTSSVCLQVAWSVSLSE